MALPLRQHIVKTTYYFVRRYLFLPLFNELPRRRLSEIRRQDRKQIWLVSTSNSAISFPEAGASIQHIAALDKH